MIARPPYDPELQAALELRPSLPPISAEHLAMFRAIEVNDPIEGVISGRSVVVEDHMVSVADGAQIVVSVIRRADHRRTDGAAVYKIHGGGMMLGDRWAGADSMVSWVEEYDAVVATVEYRLAPEFPAPTPVEDCYAGLEWFASHSDELGFDASRIMVAGASAGGGLAAGTVLLARDRRGPHIAAQLLMCPMIDDRDDTISTKQFENIGIWDRNANRFGWASLL